MLALSYPFSVTSRVVTESDRTLRSRQKGKPLSLQIESGEYRATIVAEGAGLANLSYRGRDLVLPHDPNQTPLGFSGKIMIPWPNRIAGATYIWEGETLEVAVNEPDTGAALHGLRAMDHWEVIEQGTDRVMLETEIQPTSGYPFSLATRAEYAVDSSGLSIRVTTTNTGERPAPYGVSIHPYLTCGVPLDSCVLSAPVGTVLDVNENLCPTQELAAAELGFDFTSPRSLNNMRIDHAFGGLPKPEWKVALSDPKSGRSVTMTGRDPWVQIYSGDKLGRMGIAVEPMTCPPNAFNTGTDLIILQPGDRHEFRTEIADTSADLHR